MGKVKEQARLVVNPTRRHGNHHPTLLQNAIHFKDNVLGKIEVLQNTLVEDKIKRVVREGETVGNVCRNVFSIALQIWAITLVHAQRVYSQY